MTSKQTYRGVEIFLESVIQSVAGSVTEEHLFCYTHSTGITYKRWSLSSIQSVIRHFIAPVPKSRAAKIVAANKQKRAEFKKRFVQTDAGRPSDRRNDCTVRALVAVTNIEYELAEFIAENAGRQLNKGMYSVVLISEANREGFRFKHFANRCGSLSKFCEAHPVGRFFVCIGGHALAVIDGKVYDNFLNSPMSRVQHVWQFQPSIV